MIISQHIPVMMKEAIKALNVRDNLDYIDATFGGGGYSEEILKKADCNLLSIDKDPIVKNYAKKLKVKYKKRFNFVNDDFENIYKGQVSKSGIAVLPSKRTRRTPDQKPISNLAKEALSELKSEQPEIKQENLEEEPLELKEEIDKQEEK